MDCTDRETVEARRTLGKCYKRSYTQLHLHWYRRLDTIHLYNVDRVQDLVGKNHHCLGTNFMRHLSGPIGETSVNLWARQTRDAAWRYW